MNPAPDFEPASAWVQRFVPLIPPGEVLDLACGSGRHARLLAKFGHPVLAIDRDPAALAQTAGPGIATLQLDLENGAQAMAGWPLLADRFVGIVVTNYLHRPLMDDLLVSLAPGGVLIYETFVRGNEQFGKPSNPDFLLAPGELLEWTQHSFPHALHVLAFEDGYVATPKPAMVQRICAIKECKRLCSSQSWIHLSPVSS
jgi:SAM-dependent methyltransferase